MKVILNLVLTLTLSLSLVGCASSGTAGAPSESEINAEALKAYNEVKTKAKISNNKAWNDMVQRVTQRIAAASGENFQWEAVLIEDKQVNAWCMPGGKIAVYTGIMPIVKTEAALAAVLGHEVAHATRRHGHQRYARAIQEQYAGVAIGVGTILAGQLLCQTESCKKNVAIAGMAAGFGLTFFSLKYSRGDETDADNFGLQYMAKAGYQPTEAVHLWERMGASGGGKPPEILSTHPSDETRIQNINSQMSEAQKLYQSAPQKYGVGGSI